MSTVQGKYKTLLKSTAVLSVGTFLSKLLVFFLLPLYTNYLTKSEYGTADLIANLANFLIPIFCCGISEGVLRFALQTEHDRSYSKESVFSTGMVIFFAGSAALLLFLPLFQLSETFYGYRWLVYGYVFSSNLHSLVAEYIRAEKKMTLYSAQGVLNTALVIALNLLFLLVFHFGVTGYVLSIVLADFLTSLFLILKERLWNCFSIANVRVDTASDLLKFSIPLIPTSILFWIISVSDRYIIRYYSGSDANGLYVAASKIPVLLTILCTIFLTAWNVSAVTEDAGSDEESAKNKSIFYGKIYGGYVSILFCGASALILLSRVCAKILFSEAFFEAWELIPTLVLGVLFYNLSKFLGSVYFVQKKSVRSCLTAALAATANLILNFLLIPRYGAFGAAIATALSYLLEFLIRDRDVQKHLPFPPHRIRILWNTALLLPETILVTLRPSFWLPLSIALCALQFLLNGRELIGMLKGILGILCGRSK